MIINEVAMTGLSIAQTSDNPTIVYAALELKRCLETMTGKVVAEGQGGIRLGLFSEFPELKPPVVADPVMDDAIEIDVKDGKGYIAGANYRSVLLGVYRYLDALGCRWVRPGVDGEFIPSIETLADVKISEIPSYRHRGICIEGSVSYEDISETIEWMPKVGFNAFFTQFRESYTFFDRWYSHETNPILKGAGITVEKSREFVTDLIAEMKKRDILYHAVGHGWTCEPFGIDCLGWDKNPEEPSEKVKQYLALQDGERKFWRDGPVSTNLCYGNPEVRKIIIDDIVSYSKSHTEVDILHFWLADGWNNHCECDLCKGTRPSDFYVDMMNELDRQLTELNLSTRIVFLIYVDLLWPPVKEKILNPGRFILMFAPITRTYSDTFTVSGILPEISDYERNKLEMPEGVDLNIAFLRAWQKQFLGDSFDFDYHMMWEHFNDPGYYQIGDIISRDIKGLKDIDLDGYISCQTQRSYLPTGLPMVTMGKTLWNDSLDYDTVAADHFYSEFGPDSELCCEYLKKLGELFDPVYMRGEKPIINPEQAERMRQVPGLVEEFAPVIKKNLDIDNKCWAKSWIYLKYHAEICVLLASLVEAKAIGDAALVESRQAVMVRRLWEIEPEIHPVMDVWVFVNHWLVFNKLMASK